MLIYTKNKHNMFYFNLEVHWMLVHFIELQI